MALIIAWTIAVPAAARPIPAPADRAVSPGPILLTYIANCGVMITAGNHKILIDALFDKPNPAYRGPSPEVIDKIMKGAPPFDGVDLALVTHDHPDHFEARLAVRFLEARPEPVILVPSDAVPGMRAAAADWAKIEPRVIPLEIGLGEKAERIAKGIPVTAFRTLHSGNRESPINIMYLVELGGRRIFHEGDSTGKPEIFRSFGLGNGSIDLALLHYWFPLEPMMAAFLQETFRPEHIALTHLPIDKESDAPGKIEMIRAYYKDIFLLLPGMPARTLSAAKTK